jgi:hypothetical protein
MSDSNILIGYNKNDFLYVSTNADKLLPKEKCDASYNNMNITCEYPNPDFLNNLSICTKNNTTDETIKSCLGDINISYANDYPKWKLWQDNSYNCLNIEICKNRDNADKIYQLQNNHLGSNVKLEDVNKMYKNEYTRTIHLTIGIIGIVAFIFYSK